MNLSEDVDLEEFIKRYKKITAANVALMSFLLLEKIYYYF